MNINDYLINKILLYRPVHLNAIIIKRFLLSSPVKMAIDEFLTHGLCVRILKFRKKYGPHAKRSTSPSGREIIPY